MIPLVHTKTVLLLNTHTIYCQVILIILPLHLAFAVFDVPAMFISANQVQQ